MEQLNYGWGIGFGIWVTFILFGLLVFYFLRDTEDEKTHISAQDKH